MFTQSFFYKLLYNYELLVKLELSMPLTVPSKLFAQNYEKLLKNKKYWRDSQDQGKLALNDFHGLFTSFFCSMLLFFTFCLFNFSMTV